MPLGAQVTLTGADAYIWLDRLKETVLPRLREWKGLDPTLDKQTGAIQITLPSTAVGYFSDIEPHFDMLPKLYDTRVEIHTTARSEGEAVSLVSAFGIPFMTRKEMQEGDGAGGRRDAAADGPVDPWAKFRKRGEKPRVLQNGNNKKKK